jgi:hypothetical protein
MFREGDRVMKKRLTVTLLGALALAIIWGVAKPRALAETPGTDSLQAEVRSLSLHIDELINKRLREAGVQPAPLTDDAHFFRRVSLDLLGKIPNLLDVRDFIDPTNDDPNKRWNYVEKMLKDEAYANHFANVWRASIVPSSNDNFQARALLPQFEEWFKGHLKNNTPYDKIVREILTAQPLFGGFQPNGAMQGGNSPSAFYFANELKPENLAGSTARLFLGVKLECAQCHAHPFAKWTRNQFWEYAAFFGGINPNQGRGRKVNNNNNNNSGRQITIPGINKTVKAKFLTGQEPAWKNGDDSRKILADWVTANDNPYFARAAVDMVWQYFFGVSLLEPIIEPNEDTPISHPELLDELTRQFVAHKYDLKFLIRAIVHSQAYQRSSEPAGKGTPDDLLLFARMPVRGLSPEQIFDSISEATDYKQPPIQQNRQQFFFQGPLTPRDEFLNKFTSEDKRNERETSILQALLMMNGGFLAKRTKLDPTMTSDKTATLSELDRQNINVSLHTLALQQDKALDKRLESLYLLVLSRPPRPDEMERMTRYVQGGGPAHDPRQAFADVYWALLNSGEFMLNH